MPSSTTNLGEHAVPGLSRCGCGRAPGEGRTYAGEDRAEQEAHRQRVVRRRKAQTRAAKARLQEADGVLARLDLGPAATPRVLAARLVALATGAAALAVLVELDVAATDADAVRGAAGAAQGRIGDLEDKHKACVRKLATARADRDVATVEAQRLDAALALVHEQAESIAAALGEATTENGQLEAALSGADATTAAAHAEVAELRRELSTVHTETAQAMATQQARSSTLHAKQLRAAARRAEETRRSAARESRAKIVELQEQVQALPEAAETEPAGPRLIIVRREPKHGRRRCERPESSAFSW
jgi:hypothetical protein